MGCRFKSYTRCDGDFSFMKKVNYINKKDPLYFDKRDLVYFKQKVKK